MRHAISTKVTIKWDPALIESEAERELDRDRGQRKVKERHNQRHRRAKTERDMQGECEGERGEKVTTTKEESETHKAGKAERDIGTRLRG